MANKVPEKAWTHLIVDFYHQVTIGSREGYNFGSI